MTPDPELEALASQLVTLAYNHADQEAINYILEHDKAHWRNIAQWVLARDISMMQKGIRMAGDLVIKDGNPELAKIKIMCLHDDIARDNLKEAK